MQSYLIVSAQIACKRRGVHIRSLTETDQRHAVDIDTDPSDAPYDVVDSIEIPRELAHLVVVNGAFICGDDRNVARFKESDVLALWPEVAGGCKITRLQSRRTGAIRA